MSRVARSTTPLLAFMAMTLPGSVWAEGVVVMTEVSGPVSVTMTGASPRPGRINDRLAPGTRVATGDHGRARLRFPGGSTARLEPNSDVRIDLSEAGGREGGILLTLGRIWSRVVSSGGGGTRFEVRTANAVAGVRGTVFEVGVGLDGSVRVVVDEGLVAVKTDDSEEAMVRRGYELKSKGSRRMSEPTVKGKDADWSRWLKECSDRMQKEGLQIAGALKGRVSRRMVRVQRLRQEQAELQRKLSELAQEAKSNPKVRVRVEGYLERAGELTAELRSIIARTQVVADTFETWEQVMAERSGAGAAAVTAMARDLRAVLPGFADLADEGMDLSPASMDEMMEEMRPLKGTLKEGPSPRDELFGPK